jgi:hypothetical protein
MAASQYAKLFSRINGVAFDTKSMYEDLVEAKHRITDLESQLSDKTDEIQRLAEIIDARDIKDFVGSSLAAPGIETEGASA